MLLLQKFIRNDAILTDPPNIYNLRTVLISLVVSNRPLDFQKSLTLTVIGMWWCFAIRYGYGRDWRCFNHGTFKE